MCAISSRLPDKNSAVCDSERPTTMAPPSNRSVSGSSGTSKFPINLKESVRTANRLVKKYANLKFVESLCFDPTRLGIVSVLILICELFLNVFVVQNVRYTEIDWIAYMQECEGFLNGTTNYAELRGDTGPLVYPAGFVYIFSILYFLTSRGQNVRLAQYIFVGIYLAQQFLVLRLYTKSRKLPPYVLILTALTSYRIHSIYVLRMFNDPVAMLFLYAALNMFMDQRWTVGSVLLSLGVGVKMNVLLFAPAILLLFITNLGYVRTVCQLSVCAGIQLILGAPFLFTHPMAYIRGSFDFGRVFEHKWTVNYRFLERTIFENGLFHVSLLTVHVLLLLVFAKPCYHYMQNYCRLRQLQVQFQPQIDAQNARKSKIPKLKKQKPPADETLTDDQQKFLDSFEKGLQQTAGAAKKNDNLPPPAGDKQQLSVHFDQSCQLALLPIFLANFVGVLCARSLHYQFYVWYFHSLPYLVWFTGYGTSVKLLMLAVLELCWNTYPSTDVSSGLLHAAHLAILYGIGRKLLKKVN